MRQARPANWWRRTRPELTGIWRIPSAAARVLGDSIRIRVGALGRGEEEKGRSACPSLTRTRRGRRCWAPRTRRRSSGRHARTAWRGKDEMRREKSFLPLFSQQKYNHSHRVSLLSFLPTQQATRRASPTSGPRMMLAPLISDSGWIILRVGRFSKPNSNSHGRLGLTVNLHPTDGITDGLRVGGNMWLYLL
jgi:hypothetical protein